MSLPQRLAALYQTKTAAEAPDADEAPIDLTQLSHEQLTEVFNDLVESEGEAAEDAVIQELAEDGTLLRAKIAGEAQATALYDTFAKLAGLEEDGFDELPEYIPVDEDLSADDFVTLVQSGEYELIELPPELHAEAGALFEKEAGVRSFLSRLRPDNLVRAPLQQAKRVAKTVADAASTIPSYPGGKRMADVYGAAKKKLDRAAEGASNRAGAAIDRFIASEAPAAPTRADKLRGAMRDAADKVRAGASSAAARARSAGAAGASKARSAGAAAASAIRNNPGKAAAGAAAVGAGGGLAAYLAARKKNR